DPSPPLWFALRLAPNVFGIVDAFASEEDRQAVRDGPIAKALMANAAELLASPPEIASIEVLGLKNTGAT
ncbi:MAG: antibiotic biosynthesis monooxygenase, partial [Pseudomonadota bacterium]